GITFDKLEDLDALTAEAGETSNAGSDDFNLSGVFGGHEESSSSIDPRLKDIGQNERIVYQLIEPDRDVQKIIDLSRLGEFETCKSLVALLAAEIVTPLPEGHRRPSAAATVGGIHAPRRGGAWAAAITHVALTLALAGAAVYGAWFFGFSPGAWLATRHTHFGFMPVDLQAELSRGRITTIRHALEVFHAEVGAYPKSLEALVEADLLESRELRFPWRKPYFYLKNGDGYSLLRPLY
ncbi:MAG: hypothetical protein V3T05_10845, partial [Myxococcota bacterium]